MTAQVPETLIHNGTEYALCVEPLNKYIKQQRPDIRFAWNDTSCWRGYEGTWEIKDGKLYLVDLVGCLRGDKQYPPNDPDLFAKLFPDSVGTGLFADWFTGQLRCPFGEMLEYVHAAYASTFEHELLIDISNGVVVGEEVKDCVALPGY